MIKMINIILINIHNQYFINALDNDNIELVYL